MKVIILIGEMGSGKSHVGRLMAEDRGFEFIEGDELAGPEMAAAIRDLKRITYEMVDDLVERMANLVYSYKLRGFPGVVLSQALYREKHRRNLKFLLERANIEVTFLWVRVPFFQHVRQLLSRRGGPRWIFYWLLSKPFFQRPKHEHVRYLNRRTA